MSMSLTAPWACWHKFIICPVLCCVVPSCLSHHLSPRHGVLLVSWIPVSKIVHVSSRVHWCTFGSHADVPEGARRRGGWRWGGKMLSFRSTWPILHDLLVLGSFVLEPYLHLEKREIKKLIYYGGLPMVAMLLTLSLPLSLQQLYQLERLGSIFTLSSNVNLH